MNADKVCTALEITESGVANALARRFDDSHPSLKDVPSNVKQLRAPTSGFVIEGFLAYLKHFCVEVTGIPSLGQSKHLKYIDAYSDALPFLDLHMILNVIFKANFMNDFSISDINNPTSKRNLMHFWALENLANYYSMKTDEFAPMLEELARSKTTYIEVLKRRDDLREMCNNMAKNKGNRSKRVAELEAKIQHKSSTVRNLEMEHKDLSEALSNCAYELHEKKTLSHELKENNIKLSDEIEDLKKRIVPSPAQLASLKRRHEQELEALNNDVAAQTELYRRKKAQQQLFEKLKAMQEERSKCLEKINRVQGCVSEVEQNIAKLEDNKTMLTDKTVTYREQCARRGLQLEQLNEQLVGLQVQGEHKLALKDKSIKTVKQDKKSVEANRVKRGDQHGLLAAKIQDVRSEMDEWTAARADAISAMESENQRAVHKAESSIVNAETFLLQDICQLEKEKDMMINESKKNRK